MTSFYARIDSSSANNPSINLTGAPAMLITFAAYGPSGDLYLNGGPDPNTRVWIGNQSYSFTVNWLGELPTANSQGGNQVPAQFRGDEVMRITVQDYPTAGQVTYLVFMPQEQATASEMDGFGKGRIDVQSVNISPVPVPVCYAAGTLLHTPDGPVRVEDLRPGTQLVTKDDGPQPIRWVGWTEHAWPGTEEKLRPVRIPKGSLGDGLPVRDLLVSPQHRILISKEAFPFLPTDFEQFAPALSLIGYRGIAQDQACRTVRYYHVLLARHSIIRAERLCSESFFPGPIAMRNLSFANRVQILSLYPQLSTNPEGGYGPLCRPSMTKRQAVELLGAARVAA